MRILHLPLSRQPGRLPVAVCLAALIFALATLCSGAVGLNANVRLSLADVMLYPAAVLLPVKWCAVAVAAPYAAAVWLMSGWQMAVGALIIKGTCAACMAYVYDTVDASTRGHSMMPFFAHGFLSCLGVLLYDIYGFGLLTALPALAVEMVQWVLTGVLGTALVGSVDRWPQGLQRLLYTPPNDNAQAA